MSVRPPIVEKAKRGRLGRRGGSGTWDHGPLNSLLEGALLVWPALLLYMLLSAVSLPLSSHFVSQFVSACLRDEPSSRRG